MTFNHRDLWDTRHVKSELAARAMPESKVFLHVLAITAFDWLQFTAFRLRPGSGPLLSSSQFDAWFGFGITVVGVVFLLTERVARAFHLRQEIGRRVRRDGAPLDGRRDR